MAPLVKKIFNDSKFKSISDYGAGKKNLEKALKELGLKNFDYFPYDPVFPDYGKPKPADLVCCIDVLEHIEEEFLFNILDDLVEMVGRVADSLENLVFLKNYEFDLENKVDYSSWTVKELKKELGFHGMPTYGLKADLIERLEEEFE